MYDDEESDLKGFVQELIDGGHLEEAALGIAKLVVSKGTGA